MEAIAYVVLGAAAGFWSAAILLGRRSSQLETLRRRVDYLEGSNDRTLGLLREAVLALEGERAKVAWYENVGPRFFDHSHPEETAS